MSTITVTKLESARRQLETASHLYLTGGDILSAHTLAAAAYGILEVLAERAGHQTIFQHDLLGYLPEEMANEVRKAMRGPQNFLKHADRDPDGTLDLSTTFTETLMFDAMRTLAMILGEQPPLIEAFAMWFAIQHPDLFTGVPPEVQQTFLESQRHFGHLSSAAFLELFLAQKRNRRP